MFVFQRIDSIHVDGWTLIPCSSAPPFPFSLKTKRARLLQKAKRPGRENEQYKISIPNRFSIWSRKILGSIIKWLWWRWRWTWWRWQWLATWSAIKIVWAKRLEEKRNGGGSGGGRHFILREAQKNFCQTSLKFWSCWLGPRKQASKQTKRRKQTWCFVSISSNQVHTNTYVCFLSHARALTRGFRFESHIKREKWENRERD